MDDEQENIMGGETSKLIKPNHGSSSMRTTVPKGVVKHCDLEGCSQLHWDILIDENGERCMKVSPIREGKPKREVKK